MQASEFGRRLADINQANGILADELRRMFGTRMPSEKNKKWTTFRKEALDAALAACGFVGARSGANKNKEQAKQYKAAWMRVKYTLNRVVSLAWPSQAASAKSKTTLRVIGWSKATPAQKLAFIKQLLRQLLQNEQATPAQTRAVREALKPL